MTWARIDDGFPNHPKVVAAGPICELLQVRAICYCCRYLTDGFLPLNAVSSLLTGFEHIGLMGGGVPGLFQVGYDFDEIDWPARMVEAGLWHARDGGYFVHDFLKYNPSKRAVERERRRKSQGGKIGAKRRWGKAEQAIAQPIGSPMSDPKAHPSGIPMLPYPYPSKDKSSTPASLRGVEAPTAPARVARRRPTTPAPVPAPPATAGSEHGPNVSTPSTPDVSHDTNGTHGDRAGQTLALGEVIARGSLKAMQRANERVARLKAAEGKAP